MTRQLCWYGLPVMLAGIVAWPATCRPSDGESPPEFPAGAGQVEISLASDLPIVERFARYWSTKTSWSISIGRRSLDGDGRGTPPGFFFLCDTVAVAQERYVVERRLDNGEPVSESVLRLVAKAEAVTRAPDLQGWAWSQGQVHGTRAAAFAVSVPPSRLSSPGPPFIGNVDVLDNAEGDIGRVYHRKRGLLFWRLDYSPDGTRLWCQGQVANVLWDVTDRPRLPLRTIHSTVRLGDDSASIGRLSAFSPDSRLLALSCDLGVVEVFSARSGARLRNLGAGGVAQVRSIRFTPDGGSLLVFKGHEEQTSAAFWEIDVLKELERPFLETPGIVPPTGKSYPTQEIVADGVFTCQEDQIRLMTLHRGGTVGFWDWVARRHEATVDLKTGEVEEIAVSPDGKVVAVATDKRIHFLDIATRKSVGENACEHPKVKRIRFANDNKHFASLGADGELRVWTLDFMEQIDPLKVAPQYDGQSF